MRLKLFCLLALSLLVAAPVHAAVPKLLTYQGVLKDGSGNFLTGTYSMVFRLYSASSGGSALWTETQSSVATSSGKFSVILGSVTALSLDFNADYWLSIQVGSDAEMSPRVRLTASGYSIRSDYENNGFTQSAHDALTHKNIEGVKDNAAAIAKTNFKLDAYSLASANSMGDMILDTFSDSTGINAGASSGYTWRGSANYDVIASSGGLDTYAKLALHGNGTDASTTFTDSSSGAKSVTANGNAQIDTAQSKFGGASILLDGSGDTLTVSDDADWDFGTGDFTIDFWVRFNSLGIGHGIMHRDNGGSNGWQIVWSSASGGQLCMQAGSAAYNFSRAWSPSTNTWYHIAFVRSGSTSYCFVDGTQLGSTYNSSHDFTYSSSLNIGSGDVGRDLNGWLEEIRISKGIARWTANFTPPAAEYSSSAGSATVISSAYSEPVAPTEAMVVADETLGTGSITYYVSRDNGTTWTQCAKETVTNISSQPSGTQVKWKAAISGNAELNAIAVAL